MCLIDLSLSLSLSPYLSIYLSIYLSLSIYIYIYISLYLSISLSLSIYIYIYTHVYIYIYIYLSIFLSLSLSLSIYIYIETFLWISSVVCVFDKCLHLIHRIYMHLLHYSACRRLQGAWYSALRTRYMALAQKDLRFARSYVITSWTFWGVIYKTRMCDYMFWDRDSGILSASTLSTKNGSRCIQDETTCTGDSHN